MSTRDIVTRTYLDMEIRDRLANRRWYRALEPERRPRYADLADENATVLRELLRIRNRARREAMRQDARYRTPTKMERIARIASDFDFVPTYTEEDFDPEAGYHLHSGGR